jgi:hypothetical protein
MVTTERDLASIPEVIEATRTIAELQAIPIGAPYAAEKEQAMCAIAAERRRAMEAIYPFGPIGADTIADHDFIFTSATRQDYARALIDVFPRCWVDHPKLARLCLHPAVINRVREYGEITGVRDSGELAALDYVQALAAHLRGIDEFEPWATILVETSIAQAMEADAAVSRQEAFAQAELARLKAEQRAADEAVAADRRARSERASAFFAARAGQRVIFRNNEALSCGTLATSFRTQSAMYSESGELVPPPTLDDLETLQRRLEAMEGATVS